MQDEDNLFSNEFTPLQTKCKRKRRKSVLCASLVTEDPETGTYVNDIILCFVIQMYVPDGKTTILLVNYEYKR